MVCHWRLSDSKSPQVSRTLLSIPVVFNNPVVWMVSTRPPTSKSSRPFPPVLVDRFSLESERQRPYHAENTGSRPITEVKLMVCHWRLSDSKSPQVSRTLLSIPVVFNNPVVWMVSTRPPTSKSSRPFPPVLVDRFSLESERQQVSSNFQNSS